MSKKQHDATPSLFDEPDDTSPLDAHIAAAPEAVDDDDSELEEWQEVPQAVFMTWSKARQYHYCWQRDLHAALTVNEGTAAQEFFLARAALYKSDFEAENANGHI